MRLRILAILLAAVAAGPCFDAAVAGATFRVTKTSDTVDGVCDGDCSLREAIIAANQLPGLDTIVVPAGIYLLQQAGQEDDAAAGDLDVRDDLLLVGDSRRTMIDGRKLYRVLEVHFPAVVRVESVVIRHGGEEQSRGAGIRNDGTLTLTNSSVSENSGSGIENLAAGRLTVTSSTVSANSTQGIRNEGILEVVDSTLSDNSYGGIENQGMATVEKSILSGNESRGGIRSNGTLMVTNSSLFRNLGSGIENLDGGTLAVASSTLNDNFLVGVANRIGGTMAVTNSTLCGNFSQQIINEGIATVESCTLKGDSAGGLASTDGILNEGALTVTDTTLSENPEYAIRNFMGTVALTNSTLSANSKAGISNTQGSVTITNCTLNANGETAIVAAGVTTISGTIIGNSAGNNCVYETAEQILSSGHNLDDDGSCGFSSVGDLTGLAVDLAPLGNWGGQTQTYALCTGAGVPHPDCAARSAAVDAGGNQACPSTDQRGTARPQGSECDIGAFESKTAESLATPTATVGVPARPCYGDCNRGGWVTVDEVVTGLNIALGRLSVAYCRSIDVNDDGNVTVDEIVKAIDAALIGCTS